MDVEKIRVRGLTRGEIKGLRKDGYQLETIGGLEDYEKRDEGLDRIFKLACSKTDTDELTQGEALELWTRVVAATYGGTEVKKKSGSQQPSRLREKSLTAKSAGKRASSRKGTARKSTKKSG